MKNYFASRAAILLMVITLSCTTEDDPALIQLTEPEIKAAPAQIYSYDNFMDELNWTFTNQPPCPPAPDVWTLCGYSPDGRWGRVSWNWSACPIDPDLLSTQNGELLLEVPGGYAWRGGQMNSVRSDYGYGRYRAKIKAGAHSGTPAEGTCSAFFFYSHPSAQEIDVEILNREHGERKVHFVTHPGDNQIIHTLTADPTTEYIEYGFDWYKNRIDFYAEGKKVSPSQTRSVPSARGSIMLNHWTGTIGWSGTAPPDKSVMYVQYVEHTPFLLVTFPNSAGITWTKGQSATINWEKYGDIANNPVDIEIWKGTRAYKTLASRIPNSGSFTFKVPTSYPSASDYRIKIKSRLSADYYDFSNAPFSIK